MNELRDSGVDPLIIDAGDLFFSTANLNSTNKKSELYRAGAILEGYNRVGCDAINVGHYEVFNVLSFLKSMEEKTEIPFLSANLRDSQTNKLLFEPFRIIEKGLLKIGIVGVTDKLPDTTKSMIADNYIEAGNHYIDVLSIIFVIAVLYIGKKMIDKCIKNELKWRSKVSLLKGIIKTKSWIDKNFYKIKKYKLAYVHKK